jgi:hypothetical protein
VLVIPSAAKDLLLAGGTTKADELWVQAKWGGVLEGEKRS